MNGFLGGFFMGAWRFFMRWWKNQADPASAHKPASEQVLEAMIGDDDKRDDEGIVR